MLKNIKSNIPIKAGDVLDLTIEAMGGKGDGIAKIEGYVVFIPRTAVGEKVQAKIVRTLPKMAFAEALQTLQ